MKLLPEILNSNWHFRVLTFKHKSSKISASLTILLSYSHILLFLKKHAYV